MQETLSEEVDGCAEQRYWRDHYSSRPYVPSVASFEEYAPAYRYGWEGRSRFGGRAFSEAEPDLQRDWDQFKGDCRLTWKQARRAVREAWDRVAGRAGDQ
jgi:hypothetical protein